MFVVLLKFSANRAQAHQFMDAHKAWIQQGFDDGVFLLVGNLQPGLGGGIIVHNVALAELQRRVNEDPFVAKDIVRPEIAEITPSRVDPRLAFLVGA
jgi:uncharacterized protein YciI